MTVSGERSRFQQVSILRRRDWVLRTFLKASETVREVRPILQGAELAFRVRVVVRDLRRAMCFGHAQISQQEGYRFGRHEGAAIGVQGEFASLRSGQTDIPGPSRI